MAGSLYQELDIHLELTRTMRAVYNGYSAMANQVLLPLGLTAAQGEILLYLYRQTDNATETGSLRRIIQTSPAALSGLLKQLRKKGYIQYLKHEDRRRKQITLTPAALELQPELEKTMLRLKEICAFQIDDIEYSALCQTMQTMLSNMKLHTEEFAK